MTNIQKEEKKRQMFDLSRVVWNANRPATMEGKIAEVTVFRTLPWQTLAEYPSRTFSLFQKLLEISALYGLSGVLKNTAVFKNTAVY